MFEEDFITILYKVAEEMINKRKELESKKEFYAQTDEENKENKNIEFQLMVVNDHIKIVKEFINFPRFSRIKAMSNTELAYYKQEQIDIIHNISIGLANRISKAKEKMRLLKMEQDEYALRYSISSSKVEKELYLEKGKEIKEDIDKYNKKIVEYNSSQEENIKETEILINQSLEEIRNNLLKVCNFNSEKLTNLFGSIPFMRLLSGVVDDYENASRLSGLLANYNTLCKKHYSTFSGKLLDEINKCDNYVLRDCPTKGIYFGRTFSKEKIDLLKKTFLEYRYIINMDEQILSKDKLELLVTKFNSNENVDEDFIKNFLIGPKSGPYYEECINLINEKHEKEKELKDKRNLFKKSKITEEINKINREIIIKVGAYYLNIIQHHNISASPFPFANNEYMAIFNGRCREYFEKQNKYLDNILEIIENLKQEINEEKKKNDEQKILIIDEMRDLLGMDSLEDVLDIDCISENEDENLKKISLASALCYRIDVMDAIHQQAIDFAMAKEVELKELLKVKDSKGYQKIIKKDE